MLICGVSLWHSLEARALSPDSYPIAKCHLERKPICKINARLAYDVKCESASGARRWVAYICEPPNLSRQKLLLLNLTIDKAKTRAEQVTDGSGLRRSALRLSQAAGDKGSKSSASFLHILPLRSELSAVLSETRLLPGMSPTGTAEKLLPEDRAHFLLATFSLDYKNSEFQTWLENNKLHKQKTESDLDFAWRAFICLRKKYRYYWDKSLDRRVSEVCRTSNTDCGGLAYLYCGIMRANGIPARALIGRWARSSAQVEDESGYFNCHVKSEVFINDIGWVPVDLSEAVSNRHENVKRFFGSDNGDFLVMHVDPDLIFHDPEVGTKNLRSMPDFRCWLVGAGAKETLRRHVFWKVSMQRYDSSSK